MSGQGLIPDEEIGTTCRFATHDKVWATAPGGERQEVDTLLTDSQTFGTSPQTLIDDGQADGAQRAFRATMSGPKPV